MAGSEGVHALNERSLVTAQKIIVAVFKILLPGTAARVEGLQEIGDLIFQDQKDKRQRKSLVNRLEESADLLSERLSKFSRTELPSLDEREKKFAIEGVNIAFGSVEVSPAIAIKERLDPDRIANIVRPVAVDHWRKAYLSPDAEEYGKHYLALAIRYIIALVRQLPEFSDELLFQTFATTDKIYDLLQRGITTVVLPRYRPGVPSEISAFEANYLSDIIQTYMDMELFGLTGLPPELCRQPIDVAYITLQSSLQAESGPEVGPVDVAFRAIIVANTAEGEDGTRISNPERGTRTLLVGPAGSGKTTAAHWLAIRAAEHGFGESLKTWNDCTPFIMPLRHIFRGSRRYYPTERDLVAASSQREDEIPGRWIQTKLGGHALVILDGLDELSDLHKSDFRSWLSKFQLDYPMAHIIITSRPDGLDNSWFHEHKFTRLELQPMRAEDIRLCVDAWFSAVVSTDRRREADYNKKRRRLLADLDQNPAVRELAETPLLCAMLCAFYANNLSAAAPQSRGELYERVINTLVHTREIERRSERETLLGLGIKAKLSLLQALARHLTEESQTTIHCIAVDEDTKRQLQEREPTARDILLERLRGMTPIAASVDELLEFVLERSVVFRRVSSNEAQFVHRSLQEYLAACDYADDGLVDTLIARSESGDWRQIVVFAAGRLKMPMASDLVSKILDKADRSQTDSRTLLLLAAQCYGSAGRLDPSIASRTRARLATVLPPRNLEEAELISYAGDEILPWLETNAERSGDAAICCMRTAALVGGLGGISILAAYAEASVGDPRAISELLHDWQYFDATEYASDVLADLPFENHVVTLESEAMLHSAKYVRNLRRTRITVPEKLGSFREWAHLDYLEEIDWPNNSTIVSLKDIGALRGLRKLNLSGATALRDLDSIGQLESLRELYLSGCTELRDIEGIAGLKSLRVLVLDGCISIRDFSPVGSLDKLRTLSLNGCIAANIEFCRSLNGLRRLQALTRSRLDDVSILSTCADLRRVELTLGMRSAPLSFAPGADLEWVELNGIVSLDDVIAVSGLAKLQQLSLKKIDWLNNLEFFKGLRNLKNLSVIDCHDLRYARGISLLTKIEYLDLSGSDIVTTEFAQEMYELREIHLARCRSLRDLAGLAMLPKLEYVNLTGGTAPANLEILRQQSRNAHRLVIVEDNYNELKKYMSFSGYSVS